MKRVLAVAVIACAAVAAGCQTTGSSSGDMAHHHGSMWTTVTKATVTISPTATGGSLKGTVTFTDVEGGVKVEGTVSGLTPDSTHAFHIHEFGDAIFVRLGCCLKCNAQKRERVVSRTVESVGAVAFGCIGLAVVVQDLAAERRDYVDEPVGKVVHESRCGKFFEVEREVGR